MHAPKTQAPPAHVTLQPDTPAVVRPLLSAVQHAVAQQMSPCQLGAQCHRQTLSAADEMAGGCVQGQQEEKPRQEPLTTPPPSDSTSHTVKGRSVGQMPQQCTGVCRQVGSQPHLPQAEVDK